MLRAAHLSHASWRKYEDIEACVVDGVREDDYAYIWIN